MKAILLDPEDNLAVALSSLEAGKVVDVGPVTVALQHHIPAKHKFAIKAILKGEALILYGVIVGTAVLEIPAGAAITTENTVHKAASYQVSVSRSEWNPPSRADWKSRTFQGFERSDGQVGTANIWLVFPLVFCENRNVDTIRKAFKPLMPGEEHRYERIVKQMMEMYESSGAMAPPSQETHETSSVSSPFFENVELRFLTHDGGCGGTRDDAETLCRLLAGYVNNPNVAGATILSLGCQHAEVDIFRKSLRELNPEFDKPLIILDQQEMGTESRLIEKAIAETFAGLTEANKMARTEAPISKLVLGLECGGSDGFSGISANPALGHAVDLLVSAGGSALLSEFPELCGVEQELINRMEEKEVAEKFVELMSAYERAAKGVGSGFDMNPSPGNIKDGLITDAMKSAGAAKKGGTSPVKDVLDYTEYVRKSGLNLLCTPGNDVESTSGLVGSGATLVLFTTGLGTPTGNPVAPVIKISSNSELASKMPDIIDIDAGRIIQGKATIEEVGEKILEKTIRVASGLDETKASKLRQYDFIPWKRGVSL